MIGKVPSVSETQAIKLTQHVKAGGCASKLSPAILDRVLAQLPKQTDENVLVGFDTADDAGVYRLSETQALVQTVDFFTPMVDDPFTYGQVAATNALSDVYAMGGRPVSALTILAYPESGELETLSEILRGGLSKMMEAGCVVIGGHSVKDQEMKLGYAVTGLIHPDRVWRNAGAQPGDALFLTKSLGTGVITTALKRGIADATWIAAATRSMTTLNRAASLAMMQANLKVHAVTDVTGFGLAGHGREMALAGNVSLEFSLGQLPLLAGSLECVRAGAIPGGLLANREFVECAISTNERVNPDLLTLCFDPQTAGGLLIAIDEKDAVRLEEITRDTGTPAKKIGRVVERGSGKPLRVI